MADGSAQFCLCALIPKPASTINHAEFGVVSMMNGLAFHLLLLERGQITIRSKTSLLQPSLLQPTLSPLSSVGRIATPPSAPAWCIPATGTQQSSSTQKSQSLCSLGSAQLPTALLYCITCNHTYPP
jgi:hypothetical protein